MLSKEIFIFISSFILILSIYIVILNQTKRIDHYNEIFTSIWCNNQSINGRRCKFRNLCYKVDSEEFIFIFDSNRSLLIDLPDNRFQPSLQYLSSVDHNNFYFNYVDIDRSTFKDLITKFKFNLIKNPTFIYSRFKPDNSMHSLHDDLLPLYHTVKLSQFNVKDSSLDKDPLFINQNLFIFDNYHGIDDDQFMDKFYSIIFPNSNLIHKRDIEIKNQLICFEEAEIGLSKSTIWYDYGFKQFQNSIFKTKVQKRLIRQRRDEIKNLILQDLRCDEQFVILLTRKRTRLILNENQLIDQLKKSFELEVKIIDLEQNYENLHDLIKTIHCSTTVIGMHGAGLIFSIFLNQNTNLIELFPYKINPSYYTPYKQLANIFNLNYFNWVNQNNSNNFPNSIYWKEEIKDKINSNLEVEQSLCCDEPYFMFRIYQNTIVDLNEMQQLFKSIQMNQKQLLNDDFILSPSKINFICSRTMNGSIHLKLSPPWNLINLNEIEYNIQLTIKDQSNLYFNHQTKENEFIFEPYNRLDQDKEFFVWIRGKYRNRFGPFNDVPLVC